MLRGFKEFRTRILVSTDLISRGIDVERVNVVFNYDMPDVSDTYLHRVTSSNGRSEEQVDSEPRAWPSHS